MRPEELLSFLHLAARLKDRTRHNSDGKGRSESVADHCWRLALLADLLRPEFPALNMDRVVRLCLIHDLGEAVTGDIPTFEKTAADEAEEERAIFAFLDPLPEPERGTLRALFEEALALKTPESRLCKALDKLEAVIAHNEAPLSTWIPLEYDLQRTYGWKEAEFSPYLTALREVVLRETEEKVAAGESKRRGAAVPAEGEKTMEELLLSGYCFQLDQARMVEAELEHGTLAEVDCNYETCLHRKKCEIGKRITAALEGTEEA